MASENQKLIDRIRKHFGASVGDDWVFTKGYVTEGKMLKQLVTAYESLEESYSRRLYLERSMGQDKRTEYEKKIESLEEENRLMKNALYDLNYTMNRISEISDKLGINEE